jgi:hypothetical protein
VRKLNKELKECKSKAASLLQAQIRGYLARLKFKKLAIEKCAAAKPPKNNNGSRLNYDLLLKSVRTIQSHWRGYSIRKLYRDLRLDMATKAMQFGYFCEQVN